ncbi:hypothetical protein BCR33DRAFT_732938 [Rhizoclosmatium globosum]|uniref:Uncharacterized protein n=1 Tax=Rhizoclosmatium globosum TaxID=329046 RepID=A0A1Y2D1I9_9FUNG|nr:hypothetical protein BCR33DRAFT_732938 [Rhizoclosmatium globosum]|eukprot:ORY53173.1 hypothetical protein BCR33DRAFT_732938 [Rhizoclosmatium globosum]
MEVSKNPLNLLTYPGCIVNIRVHEHKPNLFTVFVRVPRQLVRNMVWTNISQDHLATLQQAHPVPEDVHKITLSKVAEALANSPIEVFHASKFGELMNEAGSKITGWHKTKSGSYSVKVECGDGCERTFSSVSEQHMMDYVPNFNPGSSQISL